MKFYVVIISVSVNDLYKKDWTYGATQPPFQEIMCGPDDATLKTAWRVVVNIMPMVSRTSHAYSKNIGINKTFRDFCIIGLNFIDPYDKLYGRSDHLQTDDIYLRR